MAEEIEEKQPAVADDDPVPYFKVGSQTFHSGIGSHEPDAVLPWAVPEGWREDLNGPHYASRPPSVTWTPLNKAAREIHAKQVDRVKALTAPPPPPRDEKFERFMEMQSKQNETMNKMIELLAAKLLGEDDDATGKKKRG